MREVWPCLMYHEVTSGEAGPGSGVYYAVSQSRFRHHLRVLAERGLRGVSLEEQLRTPTPNAVAITFDDGHESAFYHALPALLEHGMRATFFITTSWVGQPGRVGWQELRSMAHEDMSIQSHTATHRLLSELSPAEVVAELTSSRLRLNDALGQETTTLALPGGDFPPGGFGAVAAAGYRWLATSRWGPNPLGELPRGLVRRYTVRAATDDDTFLAMIEGRSSAFSPEGLRLRALNLLRSAVGANRYARVRERLLDLWPTRGE